MGLVLLERDRCHTDIHGVQVEARLRFTLLKIVQDALLYRRFILNVPPATSQQKHCEQQARSQFHIPIIPVAAMFSRSGISVYGVAALGTMQQRRKINRINRVIPTNWLRQVLLFPASGKGAPPK